MGRAMGQTRTGTRFVASYDDIATCIATGEVDTDEDPDMFYTTTTECWSTTLLEPKYASSIAIVFISQSRNAALLSQRLQDGAYSQYCAPYYYVIDTMCSITAVN